MKDKKSVLSGVFIFGIFMGMILPASAKNAMHIVINNHLGAPEMLIDENQHVVWQAEYDEFGKATVLVQEVEFNQRLPGQYYDRETGLSYNYYRDYDPALGRYVQSDPIGMAGGVNTYGYVGGNPVMFVDPFGLLTTVVTTHDAGFGSHSAIHIVRDGVNWLYDPAGNYIPPSGQRDGSGDVMNGSDAALDAYTAWQKGTGSDVSTVEIPTTTEQEQAIKDKAEEQGGADPGECASFVSSALDGVCNIQSSRLPGFLEDNVKKANCGMG